MINYFEYSSFYMGNNIARRHHFLSQCYLKNFTKDETKDSKLYGLNLHERRATPPTRPIKFATERDFNRIESETLPATELETRLSYFEDKVDAAINNIKVLGKFEDEDKAIVLNALTLFAVRNPHRRKTWDTIQTNLANHLLSYIDSMIMHAPEGSYINSRLVTKELKDTVGKCTVEVSVPRNDHIELELRSASALIPCMFERKWILARAPENSFFLTNDFPVSLAWKDENRRNIPVGFNCSETRICFPLTKKIALIGEFEGIEGTIDVTDKFVAALNSITLSSAKQWVYTSGLNFLFMKSYDTIGYGIDTFWSVL